MFKRLSSVLVAATLTVAAYAAATEMSANHPDTYVVKRGDTLWDISARFLKKPWLWPEIWQANPQIQNPHLIFPGDVISLAYLDRVVGQVQPGPRQEAPIGAVPLADVEPFLKNLRVTDAFDHLPHVVGLEDNRLRSSGGQKAYVLGLDNAQVGQRYAVLRPTLRYSVPRGSADLDFRGHSIAGEGNLWSVNAAPHPNSEVLGHELAQMGVGTVSRGLVPGTQTVTLTLDDNGLEVRAGDRVIPLEPQPYDLHFFPHAPKAALNPGQLRILAVADALTAAGPRDVVAISGGAREGIDNGTVLSVWQQGSHVVDRVRNPGTSRVTEASRASGSRVALPDDYVAHVMIFRTFDKVSYGLVMEGVKPARVGFELKHPDATY